ncbi:MAG: ABC transporter ATP-binding protein [Oscillospiraceae bacterium]|nr:ABC transporter ATP-binding protein [Oscillospiraceae bacterium]
MLSIENVTKKYGNFTALEDISLTFENGVYGLLSPNGAGKTTLMKMLATLLFPTKGKILWDGKDILSLGGDYRGILGYLPQEFGYYKNYTPVQFLQYMAALQGLERKNARKRIDELLELVSLSEVKNKKMKQFSGGMIQRVGIAQAMLNDPKLLILDEPTAGLDPKERVRFRNLIHSLSKDRIVLLSTHIVSDIETIADQIVMIRDHKLYCCDSAAHICQQFKGKIYEVPAGTSLGNGVLLLSERQSENGTMVRLASDTPLENGITVSPTLEDAFLCIYRDVEQ